jgi:FkbM family methyltransferase
VAGRFRRALNRAGVRLGDEADPPIAGAAGQSGVSVRLLNAFARAYPRARFLEIGANDGERFDPLAPFVADSEWTGVMIEPVPYVFERLERNLAGNERVAAANVAIAESSGSRPFYYLAEEVDERHGKAIGWYDTLGSFDREHLFKHRVVIPNLEQRIETIDVPCVTVAEICAEHGIDNPDLVLIDAEGYDAQIVASIDFEHVRPRMVIYEHHHLSPEAREECELRLRGLGYGLAEDGLDTWCLDLRIDDDLARSWGEIVAP